MERHRQLQNRRVTGESILYQELRQKAMRRRWLLPRRHMKLYPSSSSYCSPVCLAMVLFVLMLSSAAQMSQAFMFCPSSRALQPSNAAAAAAAAGRWASPLSRAVRDFDSRPEELCLQRRRNGIHSAALTTAAWRGASSSRGGRSYATRTRTTTNMVAGLGMLPAGAGAAIGSAINPHVAKASVRAVAELLSCCLLGVLAAKQGILAPSNVAALSKIVYGIFLPSLLMVNVAKTCISQPVTSLLPIPVFAAIQIGVGFVISTVALRVLKIDPDTEVGREAKVCGTFQNSGILPLIFINAMFRGNPEMLTRGIAYVSFYLMGWSPTFWTVGNNILTGHLDEPKSETGQGGGATTISGGAIIGQETDKSKLVIPRLATRVKEIPSTLKRILAGSTAKRIFSPPIMACMAGLTIGLSPPLQWLLIRPGAPLGPLWAAVSNLTAAYTPSGVLVLAGSLANCPPGKWFSRDAKKTIAVVGISRWMLLPAITSGLLFGGVKYGLVPRDPMLLFVLLMESAMPSAQNSVIMLQVAGMQDSAGRCARMLCTIYLISIVPVSVLLTVFLSALKLV